MKRNQRKRKEKGKKSLLVTAIGLSLVCAVFLGQHPSLRSPHTFSSRANDSGPPRRFFFSFLFFSFVFFHRLRRLCQAAGPGGRQAGMMAAARPRCTAPAQPAPSPPTHTRAAFINLSDMFSPCFSLLSKKVSCYFVLFVCLFICLGLDNAFPLAFAATGLLLFAFCCTSELLGSS